MHDFKHASFDTHAFFFAVKCLAVVLLVCVGIRYGAGFALGESVHEEAQTAGASTAVSEPSTAPSFPAAPTARVLKNIPLPKVSATSYLLADMESGEVFAAREATTTLPIASISKLLVALVARDTVDASSTVQITATDRRETDGSPGQLRQGDSFLASDLYYPLLMESNNSVAYAFARAGGGEEFIRRMLRLAHTIGMDETLLDDSSGLSENNEASVTDLFALARYISKNAPDLFEITTTPHYTLRATNGRTYALGNFNVFASRADFVGGKTGYTDEAHETMIALFAIDTRTIAIIVLGSEDRKKDVEKLLAWFKNSARGE